MSSMGGNKIYRINSLCVPEGVPCGLCVRTTDNTHSLTLFDEKATPATRTKANILCCPFYFLTRRQVEIPRMVAEV